MSVQAKLTASSISSPLGELLSVFCDRKLCLLDFSDAENHQVNIENIEKYFSKNIIFEENEFSYNLQQQLDEYFSRKRKNFQVELWLIGTEFQQKVWKILQTIPYGTAISYKQQSLLYGDPKSIRAIASANGKNPISILVPCHRVIGNSGKLVGYAGGLHRKQKLLELENILTASLF